ncbi:MAG: hydantoinase B/oxoprolinase family protein [Pseudomonadota bacterium]
MGKYKDRLEKRLDDKAAENFTSIIDLHKDPIKWEVAYWRLLGIVNEGREITRQISASPTVKEFGECVFSIFTPTGESIGFSRGILLHMASMGSAIQWMLQNDYEDAPGINPGDIFFNNDPQIGGAHSADQAILLPVFINGEIVAWVGGLTHCMETGSTEPGGQSPSALSRYDDGQMIPCMKVGTNDNFHRDYVIMVERNVRDGSWWILDDRAKLAGCIKMRDSLAALIDEVGVDYFNTVIYEMIESGRLAAIAKTKKVLFPGRYFTPFFNDILYANPDQRIRIPVDYMPHMPCEMIVGADGKLEFNHEGLSSPGYHANNSSYACTLGNIIYTLLQDVYYDGMFNNGLADAFKLNLPEESVINCGIRYACSVWTTGGSVASMGHTRNIGMAYYAMGFREEGFAGKAASGAAFAGGIDKNGRQFGIGNFELSCGGMAAGANTDGLHACNASWNPESNLTDVEIFEPVWPLMWLGRGVQIDGGGYGRRSGGAGIESLYVIEHNPRYIESGSSTSFDFVTNWGMMGGYPAAARYKYFLTDTNYKEAVEKQLPLPHSEGEDPEHPEFASLLKGKLIRRPAQSASTPLKPYDIIHQTTGGGGGWGDPILRDPEAVLWDLKNGFISKHAASNVYCVAWDPETFALDREATATKRFEMRTKRLTRGVPAQEWFKTQREKLKKSHLSKICITTYNDCFKNSPKFLDWYKKSWDLDDAFQRF